jgi:hypothetical protein
MLSCVSSLPRGKPIATDSRSDLLVSEINAFREREPDPFTAEPDAVEAHVREAADLLHRIDDVGREQLSDAQWRYVHETSMRSVRFAHARLENDRHRALDILERLFRLGGVPNPAPDGRYEGELISVSTGLLSDPFFEWLTRVYLPWQGKTFNAATATGDNVFVDNAWSKATSKFGWPAYRTEADVPEGYVRVFPFRTYVALDIEDEEIEALRINYAGAPNPLPVRRMVDEIVELPGGYILGKAHMRGIRELRRVCFFGLIKA